MYVFFLSFSSPEMLNHEPAMPAGQSYFDIPLNNQFVFFSPDIFSARAAD